MRNEICWFVFDGFCLLSTQDYRGKDLYIAAQGKESFYTAFLLFSFLASSLPVFGRYVEPTFTVVPCVCYLFLWFSRSLCLLPTL